MHQAKPLHTLTAVQVLTLLYNGYTTVEKYTHALLGRVKSRDHIVKAWEYMVTLLALLPSDKG
jgi:hypothetical protein